MKATLSLALFALTATTTVFAQSPEPLPTLSDYTCSCADASGESEAVGSVAIQVDGHATSSDIEAAGDAACKAQYGAESLHEVKVKQNSCVRDESEE